MFAEGGTTWKPPSDSHTKAAMWLVHACMHSRAGVHTRLGACHVHMAAAPAQGLPGICAMHGMCAWMDAERAEGSIGESRDCW